MPLAEVIVAQIQSNGSFKILNLLAECVRQPRQTAAVHPQCVVLLLDMGGGNAGKIRHPAHNRLFGSHHFGRTVPTRRIFVEIDDVVGFYDHPGINLATERAFNRVWISLERVC